MRKKKETVNWFYEGKEILSLKDVPENAISFIYRIDNLSNGMYYFGRKTMIRPQKKNSKIKTLSEYPWKSYCGSSKALLADLRSGHKYSKTVLAFCYSKAETTYLETKTILCEGALEDPMSYNFWVKATIYSKHLMKR